MRDIGCYSMISQRAAAYDRARACTIASATCLTVLRAAGKGAVLARLEALLNNGVIGVAGACKVYKDAFGGKIIAVPAKDVP